MENSIEPSRLTTIDNPWDPFDQFDSWLMYDIDHGYDCCSIIARLAKIPSKPTVYEETEAVERAINEFIEADPTNLYTKVRRGEFNNVKNEFKRLYKEMIESKD